MIALDFQEWFQNLNNIAQEKSAEAAKLCISCRTALSAYLDAYYGKDPIEAKMCRPCRKHAHDRR